MLKAAARLLLVAPAMTLLACNTAAAATADATVPAPAADAAALATGVQKAVFAGGCFWGVDAVFKHVKGVTHVVSGYAGGSKETAVYEEIGTGRTGHAESVEVTYDPALVSYGTLLKVFFTVAHDPTELNRQGPDVGTQYRSTIFFANDAQRSAAEAYMAELTRSGVFRRPIVTTLEPLRAFYEAEAYHQNYLALHPTQPYIVYNDLPKLDLLKRRMPELYVGN
jgi:peptide-methionine (S)-S-oxide reductase